MAAQQQIRRTTRPCFRLVASWAACWLVGLCPALALGVGETFTLAKEEPTTSYTRRWNWCHPRPSYYSTTRHGDEDPRLDESRDPDGSYQGTATAEFVGLPPGHYEVHVFYRRSVNRTHCVPWTLIPDGDPARIRTGSVDQYADEGPDGDWYLLEETRREPIPVGSALRLIWSVDGARGCFDGRSVSYGGVRAIRVSDGPVNRAPSCTITSPAAGSHHGLGQPVRFVAEVADPDGDPVRVAWHSALDGPLGEGTTLERADLRAGVHEVTATATDEQARTEDRVRFTIGDPGAFCGERTIRAEEWEREQLLDVRSGSPTRLAVYLPEVPDPAALVAARLTFQLTDADHPGEEGTLWVNGRGPLDLPADPSWESRAVDAALPVPVEFLVAGRNTIEFGAGPRDRTYFLVSHVALTVQGAPCGSVEPSDSGLPPGDGGTDRADLGRAGPVTDAGSVPNGSTDADRSAPDFGDRPDTALPAPADHGPSAPAPVVTLSGDSGCRIGSTPAALSGTILLGLLGWLFRRRVT